MNERFDQMVDQVLKYKPPLKGKKADTAKKAKKKKAKKRKEPPTQQ